MTKIKKYNFSLTGASAMITETLIIAKEYDRLKDWKAVENSIKENNLLMKIKDSTFKREFVEIKKRLLTLNQEQLNLLINGDLDETKAIIFLSLVKTYTFFFDFITEVIRNKYLMFDYIVSESDYIKFFNSKSLIHEELNNISDKTAKKVKQVIFKLMEQVGIITNIKNGSIIKPMISDAVIEVIIKDNPEYLSVFFYQKEEIIQMQNNTKYA
jgi:hypothetical protein